MYAFSANGAGRRLLGPLIVSVLFGAAAGAVGTLVVMAYLAPAPILTGASPSLLRERARVPSAASLQGGETAARPAVALYAAKAGQGPLERTYVPAEAVGAGMVLTSDGWVVSYGDMLTAKGRRPSMFVAVIAGRVHPVERAVRDPYSDVVFLKIDASNLAVASFGEAEALQAGDTLFAFDAAGGLRRLDVLAFEAAPPKDAAALHRSSERLQRVLRVSGGPLPVGAMVLDPGGEAVGVYAGGDGFGATVVPIGSFSGVIGDVLRDKEPGRPFLGVRYVDLAELAVSAQDGLPQRGALVAASADGKVPALVPRGPAALAGLRAGDVITAVDGVQLSSKKPLADLLIDYAPGDAVSLAVLRPGGEELTLEATLGVTPVQ